METHVWAHALYLAAQEHAEHDRLLNGLRRALRRRGKLSLLPHIARAYQRIVENRAHEHTPVLRVAHRNDVEVLSEELNRAKQRMGVADQMLRIEHDPSIIGGYCLEAHGAAMDASYKRMLLDLYRTMLA